MRASSYHNQPPPVIRFPRSKNPRLEFYMPRKNDTETHRACSECRYALSPVTGSCTNFECRGYKMVRSLTLGQLAREFAEPTLFHGRAWGDWTLDTKRRVLVFEGRPTAQGFLGSYEIDLENVRDSAAMLDWIFQIRGKRWATSKVLRDLINALNAIFAPQRNLCSGACGSGRGGQAISGEFIRQRIATVGRER